MPQAVWMGIMMKSDHLSGAHSLFLSRWISGFTLGHEDISVTLRKGWRTYLVRKGAVALEYKHCTWGAQGMSPDSANRKGFFVAVFYRWPPSMFPKDEKSLPPMDSDLEKQLGFNYEPWWHSLHISSHRIGLLAHNSAHSDTLFSSCPVGPIHHR